MQRQTIWGAETLYDNDNGGEGFEIKIDHSEVRDIKIDIQGIKISKNDFLTSLDCEDINFSTFLIWISSSL